MQLVFSSPLGIILQSIFYFIFIISFSFFIVLHFLFFFLLLLYLLLLMILLPPPLILLWLLLFSSHKLHNYVCIKFDYKYLSNGVAKYDHILLYKNILSNCLTYLYMYINCIKILLS